MRILLSAFACDPYQGSEEGVGWTWAYQLAKAGHEVCVLTRVQNRPAIERKIPELDLPNLHFEYVGVRGVPFCMPGVDIYPYYFCWQWNAYFQAKRLHRERRFEIVHHISYGVFRNPSYLYLLGIPLIFGPVGGGERSPRALRVSMSTKGKCFEVVRDVINLLPYFDPFWRLMLRRCTRIIVKTEETRSCLPRKSMERAVVTLENMIPVCSDVTGGASRGTALKLLFAGRLLSWKGAHLAVKAMGLALKQTTVELTIVGRGPEEARLKDEVRRLKLEDFVHFAPWMPKSEVLTLHASHDALLFPSLHDSSGTVVMEAIAHGNPVICLDLGGPAVTVDEHCSLIVRTGGKTEEQVIQGIAEAILDLARMPSQKWDQMRRAAVNRARFYAPEQVIARVYGPLLNPKPLTCEAAHESEEKNLFATCPDRYVQPNTVRHRYSDFAWTSAVFHS